MLGIIYIEDNEIDDIIPWYPFNESIVDIVHNLESEHKQTIPNNTNEYVSNNKVDIIQKLSDVDTKYQTCRDITSSGYELPIGLPSYNTTKWYNDSWIQHNPNWKICYIHSMDTFIADLSMFNQHHYYSFQMQWMLKSLRCYRDKQTKPLLNSLYFNGDKYHINILFLVTGNAVKPFQHFMIYIPIRFAMIYEWLLHLIKITENSQYYLNITIGTQIDWNKRTSVHVWFWNLFGFKQGINRMHDNMNITVIDVDAWCAGSSFAYYAPFVITPYFIDMNANWPDTIVNRMVYHRRLMFAWNSLHSIKHLVTNIGTERDHIIYLGRGSRGWRGVTNNNDIIEYLKASALNHGYKFMNYECCHGQNKSVPHFDEYKAIFSRAKICIGPHGGKFGNLLFMQSGSYVIEFNNWFGDIQDVKTRDRPFYYILATANALKYYYLSPDNFSYNEAMTIDVSHLDAILNQIYDRIENE